MLEAKTTESAQTGLELDIRAFELEIEKEIDNLFIPFGNDVEAKGQPAPSPMAVEPPKPTVVEIPSVPAAVLAPAPAAIEAEELILSFGQPAAEPTRVEPVARMDATVPDEPEGLTLVLESPEESRDDLQPLLETFQASYLSFDWDYSSPNVSALGEVLTKLEPHCLKAPETESLYKIMKAVLQRVSSRPDSISPQLIEVMRDAQGLLKRFLLAGREGLTPGDRGELKALIARVQAIRNSQAPGEPRPAESTRTGLASPASDAAHSGEPEPPMEMSALEGSPEDFGDWVDQARQQLRGTLQGIQDIHRRLFQLEEILVSKPALAPLTNRIKSVRSSLEQQLSSIRAQESFWSRMTVTVQSRGIRWKDDGLASGSASGNDRSGLPDLPSSPSSVAAETSSSPHRVQREQVCLITLAGRKYAVLSASIVKVQSINGKKMKNILSRGYARLKDFKPLFRNIKAGLFGTWMGLPARALQTFQFIPLHFNGLGHAEPSPDQVKGTVLVSNGSQHGIIWSETGNIDLIHETIHLASEPSVILGRIHLDHGEEVEVLNVDHLLEMQH
ncbi:MAG: hypothetical protein MUF52_02060 [Syntrophobacteraceae bacterium]|jgi:hypothetical protein|nr:hypothetical protein [Syntrophobacteraceae bacterium]